MSNISEDPAKQFLIWVVAPCLVVGAVGISYAFGRWTAPPSAAEAMRREERLELLKQLSPRQRELLGVNLTPHERKALGIGR
jgi:hypothetical protein